MGSSSDLGTTVHTQGIIPRVIRHIFHVIEEKESQNANASYKVQVSFLEIYGEDIRDLLDQTRSSKVSIREAPNGDVFVAGAREEVVTSVQQMSKTLEDGTKNRTTASTRMNLTSSRSHGNLFIIILYISK
jgi:Kinesin motor domain